MSYQVIFEHDGVPIVAATMSVDDDFLLRFERPKLLVAEVHAYQDMLSVWEYAFRNNLTQDVTDFDLREAHLEPTYGGEYQTMVMMALNFFASYFVRRDRVVKEVSLRYLYSGREVVFTARYSDTMQSFELHLGAVFMAKGTVSFHAHLNG